MSFIRTPRVPPDATDTRLAIRGSALAALAIGLAALSIGAMPAIAEDDAAENGGASKSESEISAAAESEALEADGRPEANDEGAEESATVAQIEAEATVREDRPPQIKCQRVKVVSSRIPKRVCTAVAQQEADDEHSSRQAREYLRRLEEQSTINPPREDPYIRSSLPGF